MVLTTDVLAGPFAMDGATVSLGYPNYFVATSDLVVTKTDSQGNVTVLVLGADYTVTGTVDTNLRTYNNGGTVVLTTAYLAGNSILISRRTPRLQGVTFAEGGPFPAASIEIAQDREILILQEDGLHFQGFIDGPPLAKNWSGLPNTYQADDYFRFRRAQAGGPQGIVNIGAPGFNLWKTYGQITTTPVVPVAINSVVSVTVAQSPYAVPVTPSVLIAATAGPTPMVIALPAATGSLDQVTVKKMDGTDSLVAVVPNGTDSIDGAASTADTLLALNSSATYIDYAAGMWVKI